VVKPFSISTPNQNHSNNINKNFIASAASADKNSNLDVLSNNGGATAGGFNNMAGASSASKQQIGAHLLQI